MTETVPLLGAVLIAKDEAANIERCLVAAAFAGVEVVTLLDTGSTDDTVAIAQRVAAETGLDLRVAHTTFVNFGQARSEAFALAHGTARWLVALDADMALEVDDDFAPDPAVDAYTVRMGNGGAFTWRLPLVLNGSIAFVSIGRCHEYTARADGAAPMRVEPTDAVRVRYVERSSPAKTEWQREMLYRDLEERPDDPRTTFYLAQCERELGNDAVARVLYQHRAAMPGFEAERWYAQYRAALLAPEHERIGALMAAWEWRPTRLEPVAALLRELNYRSLHRVSWAIGTAAWTNAVPDDLFVHRDAWPQVAAELAIAGWHTDQPWAKQYALLALDNPDLTPAWRATTESNLAMNQEAA